MKKEISEYSTVQEHTAALLSDTFEDIDKMIIIAILSTAIQNNPAIAELSAYKLAEGLATAMEPDKTLSNWRDINFIPDGENLKIVFSANYLQKLAQKNGAIKVFNIYNIHDGDMVMHTGDGTEYRINPMRKENTIENFNGILVEIILANGEKKTEAIRKDHIEKIRTCSQDPKSIFWTKWYFDMARKIAIKFALKGIEISESFSKAVDIDNKEYSFSKKKKAKRNTREGVSALDALDASIEKASSKILEATVKD